MLETCWIMCVTGRLPSIWASVQDTRSTYLVCGPAGGDVRPASVSQHQISHAVHTGLLAHFGAKGWLVAPHLCHDEIKTALAFIISQIHARGTFFRLPFAGLYNVSLFLPYQSETGITIH